MLKFVWLSPQAAFGRPHSQRRIEYATMVVRHEKIPVIISIDQSVLRPLRRSLQAELQFLSATVGSGGLLPLAYDCQSGNPLPCCVVLLLGLLYGLASLFSDA